MLRKEAQKQNTKTMPTVDLPKLERPFGKLYEGIPQLDNHLMSIEEHKRQIGIIVKGIQGKCKHLGTYKEEYTRPERRDKALVSRICNDCGFNIPKPAGTHYEICERCWGPMTNRPGDSPSLYHCTVCNHPTIK